MTIADRGRAGRTGRRVARSLGALLASAVLLAGCALVDDARRELEGKRGTETGTDAGPGARPATTPADPAPVRSPSGSPGAGADPSATSGGCPPSGTLVRTGEVNAAMGLRVMGIELVNCGSVPVTLNGYPEVRLLDDGRAPLQVTVVHGSAGVATVEGLDTPPAPVTAAPGEWLVAVLVWRNRVEMAVDPVDGTYLEVVPVPGQSPQTVRPAGPIDLGTTGRLGVTAWGPATR